MLSHRRSFSHPCVLGRLLYTVGGAWKGDLGGREEPCPIRCWLPRNFAAQKMDEQHARSGDDLKLYANFITHLYWCTEFANRLCLKPVDVHHQDQKYASLTWSLTCSMFVRIITSQGRGWQFNFWMWSLLSTWQKELARWSLASCALALACRPSVSKGKYY